MISAHGEVVRQVVGVSAKEAEADMKIVGQFSIV